MKRGRRIALIVAIVLVITGVGSYFLFFRDASADSGVSYTTVTIETGDIEKSVVGTGTLAAAASSQLTLGYEVSIDEILVQAGGTVSEGDLLCTVDTAALPDVISSLETQLTALDRHLASAVSGESTTGKVTAPAAGRVKEIFAAAGDRTEAVEAEYGALLTLSLDGKMKAEIETDALAVGESVTVAREDGTTVTGTVEAASGGKASVTFSDAAIAVGERVSITREGETLGSAQAQINRPISITAADGTVSKIYTALNKKVSSGSSLFYLTDMSVEGDTAALMQQREETYAALLAAKKTLAAGGIAAEVSGAVAQWNAESGSTVPAGESLLTLYEDGAMQMSVAIDELDIGSVAVGQTAQIVMDAAEDVTYTGTVESVSAVGTASGGVTTYAVLLSVEADENVKIGMNGTATIVVEQAQDVVLVPLQALQTSKGQQYVWLKDETTDETAGNPGTQVAVTTGLSNDDYAEVLSGLSAGDEIVIVRTATAGSNDMMGFGGMMGGEQMPMGGGEMPSGGNGGRPGGDRSGGN